MKLIGFQIKNIKSIKDTGWCYTSDNDNITVFAGQNEAGKSAILEGLNFFRNGTNPEFERLSVRNDSTFPYVECEFQLDDDDRQADPDIIPILGKLSIVKLHRGDVAKADYAEIKLSSELTETVDIEIKKIIQHEQIATSTNKVAQDAKVTESSTSVDGEEAAVPVPSAGIDPDAMKQEIHQHFLNHLPQFIFYASFENILPGSVQLSEIGNYKAIDDFQKVFDIKFADIVTQNTQGRSASEYTLNKSATVDLNTYWKQRQTTAEDDHYEYAVKILPNTTDVNLSIIEFLIHRNDGVHLFVEQKSKGFQWFSSFNLRLKALGVDLKSNNKYIVLIDEPGQGLHETAQTDVKSVLEELACKGMQILYTTHNPCLIGVSDKEILRIRLVYQTRGDGTQIKNIAQYSSLKGSQDALSPIITAMGISSIGQLLDRTVPCVALEGITDHYYFTAMKKVLNIQDDYSFIPAIGVDNVRPLISVLLGWGTDFRAVFDDGAGKKLYTDVSKFFYSKDDAETKKHIFKMDGFNGIEDLFSKADFDKYVLNGETRTDQSKSNSEYVKSAGKKKELLARLFLEKISTDAGTITLSAETKKNFQAVFDWLKKPSNP